MQDTSTTPAVEVQAASAFAAETEAMQALAEQLAA